MSDVVRSVMRDVLIAMLHQQMLKDRDVFFITADFGAPALDRMRAEIPDRVINVGIAEANCIAVATGLALEGYTVYCYGIAPFISQRAYEQIRIDLSLLSHTRELNVNIISVGVGFSYDVSGPTHQCVEDMTIMRLLPNLQFFSPCDAALVEAFVPWSLRVKKPKYLRFDGKPQPIVYDDRSRINFDAGFCELIQGKRVCLVATGHATHKAMAVAASLAREDMPVGVVDLFMLEPLDKAALFRTLDGYDALVTIEESLINRGGLDSLVSGVMEKRRSRCRLLRFGVSDRYVFANGSREDLHRIYGMDDESIACAARGLWAGDAGYAGDGDVR
jgi:transketolase